MNRDPIGYMGVELNLYEYVKSSPVFLLDALGLYSSGPSCADILSDCLDDALRDFKDRSDLGVDGQDQWWEDVFNCLAKFRQCEKLRNPAPNPSPFRPKDG